MELCDNCRHVEFVKLTFGLSQHRIECNLTEEHYEELNDYLSMYDLSGINSFLSFVGWAMEREIDVRTGGNRFRLVGLISNLTVKLAVRLYQVNPTAFAQKCQPDRRRAIV